VRFSGFRDRAELGRVFASADLHVVPLKPGVASASVPSKLLSIFASGRPALVVADPSSPAARIVAESGAGWLVEPGDAAALTETLRAALCDRDGLASRGAAGRSWAEANATMARLAEQYESVLSEAILRFRSRGRSRAGRGSTSPTPSG
jgi:glycosyltransferase involved in cell wall biosynthesis